ncbi:phosphopantothenoylcysteine decarboxylase isoform X1 [Mixophyes fleayi]|uniref:phosphopantothenoylcysteine decarboxylase isoform X1 n=1 Tax=Mixophyes fleayi TaxID=3061075 RepID=UPI003F4E42B4
MDISTKRTNSDSESAGDMTSPISCGAHVLVGVTGSVAALKLPLLVSGLLQIPGVQVQVVSTEKAKHFYNVQDISVPVYSDEDEWKVRCGTSALTLCYTLNCAAGQISCSSLLSMPTLWGKFPVGFATIYWASVIPGSRQAAADLKTPAATSRESDENRTWRHGRGWHDPRQGQGSPFQTPAAEKKSMMGRTTLCGLCYVYITLSLPSRQNRVNE